jgi:sulfite reductase (NADPH) flavoprotein alpha-component
LQPENKTLLQEFLAEKDLIDFFQEFVIDPSQFCCYEFLAPLLPRFYSISSSLRTHPEHVHLLVALSSYQYKEETRYGVASHFLCNLAIPEQTTIPLYVQPSRHFRLPDDPNADLIMIGPGTGVAPYRAFLQERLHQNAPGKNWLFFGGRNRSNDFFYESFWNLLIEQGKLKVSTAFSRDQEEKEYVQHKLLEQAEQVWAWLESGAYFYVCGDASKMAKDVEAALCQLIQTQGNLSPEQSKLYLKSLKTSKRYLTDVY